MRRSNTLQFSERRSNIYLANHLITTDISKKTQFEAVATLYLLSVSTLNPIYSMFPACIKVRQSDSAQSGNHLPITPPPPGVVTGNILVSWRDSLTAMLLIFCRSALNASFLVNLEVSPLILCKSACRTTLHQNRFSPSSLSTAR